MGNVNGKNIVVPLLIIMHCFLVVQMSSTSSFGGKGGKKVTKK